MHVLSNVIFEEVFVNTEESISLYEVKIVCLIHNYIFFLVRETYLMEP